ncbi:MAG: hypothetical protein M3Y76_06520, partial [Chloroflexota bacterium]|nr:hypothetical protein [Chloroflexota bacterium]
QIDSNVVINIIQKFQRDIIPAVRSMPEFVAFYVISRGSERMTTVGIFESPQGAEKANRLVLDTIRNMGALVVTSTEKVDGEAVIRISRQ